MLAPSLDSDPHIASRLANDVADVQLVAVMRLVLSVSVLLAIFVDPSGLSDVDGLNWVVFLGYALHSLTLTIVTQLDQSLSQSKRVHWLDVAWYGLMIACTGGASSFFFLFFFFAILTSSFGWGFEEGAKVTLASSAIFTASAVIPGDLDLPRLLLRTSFLLSLGYICAYWGESKLVLRRKLVLLRDVSLLSNPRFGVDRTLTHLLEKTRAFFKASSCLLVMRDNDSGTYSLRAVQQDGAPPSVSAEPISAEAARELTEFAGEPLIVHSRPALAWLTHARGTLLHDSNPSSSWRPAIGDRIQSLAALLEVPSFISAPVPARRSTGRIYVLCRSGSLGKADAQFLGEIVAQAFPVIENIELLDHMASDAASKERQKMALDLHDRAIQPYIGLSLGLSALRKKASNDNPLVEDLEKLSAMAAQVIDDLRRYAGTIRQQDQGDSGDDRAGICERQEASFLAAMLKQAAQVRAFYGIDIDVQIDGNVKVNDRLTAEVLQLVREGLSNICKHTVAERGRIALSCSEGWLNIDIVNEGNDVQAADFAPRSIGERALALGGWAKVRQGPDHTTTVQVAIPL